MSEPFFFSPPWKTMLLFPFPSHPLFLFCSLFSGLHLIPHACSLAVCHATSQPGRCTGAGSAVGLSASQSEMSHCEMGCSCQRGDCRPRCTPSAPAVQFAWEMCQAKFVRFFAVLISLSPRVSLLRESIDFCHPAHTRMNMIHSTLFLRITFVSCYPC